MSGQNFAWFQVALKELHPYHNHTIVRHCHNLSSSTGNSAGAIYDLFQSHRREFTLYKLVHIQNGNLPSSRTHLEQKRQMVRGSHDRGQRMLFRRLCLGFSKCPGNQEFFYYGTSHPDHNHNRPCGWQDWHSLCCKHYADFKADDGHRRQRHLYLELDWCTRRAHFEYQGAH